MTIDRDKLAAELTTDEGLRLRPYQDTRGKTTIGVGRNLTDDGITPEEAGALLDADIERACGYLDSLYPWWSKLPSGPSRVLANLCFNVGPVRLATFVRFLDHMESHEWELAKDELVNSAWWKQVGDRGPRMLSRMMDGV